MIFHSAFTLFGFSVEMQPKVLCDDVGNCLNTTNKCEKGKGERGDKMKFKKIRKRDGCIEESKVEKITNAMAKTSVA